MRIIYMAKKITSIFNPKTAEFEKVGEDKNKKKKKEQEKEKR
jgi:hypothetical protein